MLFRFTTPPLRALRAAILVVVAALTALQPSADALAQKSWSEAEAISAHHGEAEVVTTPEYRVASADAERLRRSLVLEGASDLISLDEAERALGGTRQPVRRTRVHDPYRFWKWPAQDALAIVKGLRSEEALMVVGSGAVLLLAARHDSEISSDLTNLGHEPAEMLVKIIEEFGNVRSVRPFAGVVFLGSLMTDDRRFQDAAFTSFEAVIMANLVTSGLKSVFGRARPFQDQGALEFKPFSGNTSFPSGHSTTAFAFVTPWLMYYPNAFTPGLMVLGAGTAFTRMLTDNHWFTDIVAGGAIGFATAYLLSRHHQDEFQRIRVEPSLSPEHVGVTFALKMP